MKCVGFAHEVYTLWLGVAAGGDATKAGEFSTAERARARGYAMGGDWFVTIARDPIVSANTPEQRADDAQLAGGA